MSAGGLRILVQTGLAAVVSTALGAVVNVATDSAATTWVWAAVVVLTAAAWLLAFWDRRRPPHPEGGAREPGRGVADVNQTVSHTQARDIIQINDVTGDVSIASPGWRWSLATAAFAVLLLGVAVLPYVHDPPPRRDAPVPAPATSTPGAPSPDTDVTMHEIWASSAGNVSVEVPYGSWVMTDFIVTLPYIRSVEIAAAPTGFGGSSHGRKVLLRILDAHGQEIDSGEAPIDGYRAKYVFSHAVDVRPYRGEHLYLQLRNISGDLVHSYFTINDRNPAITSYVPCGAPIPTLCPNPVGRDLDALVIGRTGPW